MKTLTLETRPEEMQIITRHVAEAVRESGVAEGLCVVYCPHTTAGLTINENADPDVQHDLLLALREAFPDRRAFRHFEGNSAAHAKALACGASVTVPVSGGGLQLGTWQGIYLCEFDGPRTRRVHIQIMGQ